jgi:hypothetical protein
MLAFPWGYQALIWAAGWSFALSSCMLWGIIYVLLTFRPNSEHPLYLAFLVAATSFLCLLSNEAAFFSLCVAGLIVFARPQIFYRHRAVAIAFTLAPLLGSALWALTYEISKPANPFKTVTSIDFRSVLSGIYYQYTNLEVFDVWFNNALRQFTQSTINFGYLTVSILLLCGIPFVIWRMVRDSHLAKEQASPPDADKISDAMFFFSMLIVLLGSTSIYALAGGYSADARKRYFIVPLLIITVGSAAWVFFRRYLSRASWDGWIATSALCVVGCLTSFLMMSLWQHELMRLNALADIIAENRLSGTVTVEWNPSIHDIWPNASRSWGEYVDAEWTLNVALDARGNGPVALKPDSTQRIFWDGRAKHWTVQPAVR